LRIRAPMLASARPAVVGQATALRLRTRTYARRSPPDEIASVAGQRRRRDGWEDAVDAA
jgi:hypothetical protein